MNDRLRTNVVDVMPSYYWPGAAIEALPMIGAIKTILVVSPGKPRAVEYEELRRGMEIQIETAGGWIRQVDPKTRQAGSERQLFRVTRKGSALGISPL
jgi:hypothetical protein